MALDNTALNTLFREARARCAFLDEAIPEATLRAVYNLLKQGPTTVNSSPARIVFVTSEPGRAALRPALGPALDSDVAGATLQAPVTAIVAYDSAFHEQLPRLLPDQPQAAARFVAQPEMAQDTAQRGAAMQAAYLIMAARGVGLGCWLVGEFDRARVDAAFLSGTRWRSSLLVDIGYVDRTKEFPRRPRLDFEDVCRIV
jgi:3-hydroxypropanoate dehydrogenase